MSVFSMTRAGRRRALGAACSTLVLAAVVVTVGASAARATVFTNPTAIAIPEEGQASPYPSPISVSGLSGTIVDVDVTLVSLSHTFADDIYVLLVGPSGQNVILMSGVGGGFEVASATLTLDDEAAGLLPDEEQIVSGTFKPSLGEICICGFDGPPPAPAPPHGSTLSVFDGTAPNGAWDLYVFDDFMLDAGSIAGGWSLSITTSGPSIASFDPTSGPAGTPVTITGTSLSEATSVTFGEVAAEFSVDSPTQITAIVPPGAASGPIAVTTPGGAAVSSTDFTVNPSEHARKVSLQVGNKARGRVSVVDGSSACAADVLVKVQRREAGTWVPVGGAQSQSGGTFVVPGTNRAGRYRAVAPKATLPSGDVCLKAISRVVEH